MLAAATVKATRKQTGEVRGRRTQSGLWLREERGARKKKQKVDKVKKRSRNGELVDQGKQTGGDGVTAGERADVMGR